MRKHPWWTFGGNDPWVTTTHKRSNGKRGIFLAVSPANQSDWICTKQIRIHQCKSAWDMDGTWKAYPLSVLVERQTLWITVSYCKLGSYTSMRHNSVRDSEAQIMREVCRDVHTEPTLLPINENDWKKSQHCWQCKVGYLCERTVEQLWENFLWQRITHPTSQSYSGKSLAEVYQQHGKENDKYNQRVIDREVFIQSPCLHNNWRDCTRMQQSQQ